MANVLCVLYDDPREGYPPEYARDDIPTITSYRDGQSTPTPEAIDFKPGELLGCVSGELGLRRFLEARGHRLIVTSDKDGSESVFERELPEAEIGTVEAVGERDDLDVDRRVVDAEHFGAYLPVLAVTTLLRPFVAEVGRDVPDLPRRDGLVLCERARDRSRSVGPERELPAALVGEVVHLLANGIGAGTQLLHDLHVLFRDWIVKFEVKMKSAAQKLLLLLQAARTPAAATPATATAATPRPVDQSVTRR